MAAPRHQHRHDAERLLAFFDGPGFFAEVGVAGPTAGSRTWLLEQAGWRGALIEPQPDVAAFLVTARSATLFACACVGPGEAGTPLPLRVPNPLATGAGRRSAAVRQDYFVMVPTRTLDDVLGEAQAPAPLDLLVLDARGREADALDGFDFGRWQPRLVLIADPLVDLRRHRRLGAGGYGLIRRAGGCGWYVPADAPAAVQTERFAIARDFALLPFRAALHGLRRLMALD